MSLTINMYNITSEPKTVEKTLGQVVHTGTCSPYEPLSDITGYVILDYNAAGYGANYATLGSKSYFVYDRELLTGSKMKIFLRTDVLSTYWSGIKECDGIATQSSAYKKMNYYMTNPAIKFSDDPQIFSINVGNAFTFPPDQVILCAVGAQTVFDKIGQLFD